MPGHRYRGGVEPLVAYLADFYPADHEVVHYMAAQVPGFAPVVHAVALDRLADEVVTGASTLYVPPLGPGHPPEAPSFEPAVVDVAGAMAPTAEGASQPGALVDLLVGLATDPDEMTAYAADPLRAVSAAGLDVVEQFALLGGHTGLVQEAVRLGSGPAAAVSLGLTRSEAQAVASCVGWLEREAERRAQASGRR